MFATGSGVDAGLNEDVQDEFVRLDLGELPDLRAGLVHAPHEQHEQAVDNVALLDLVEEGQRAARHEPRVEPRLELRDVFPRHANLAVDEVDDLVGQDGRELLDELADAKLEDLLLLILVEEVEVDEVVDEHRDFPDLLVAHQHPRAHLSTTTRGDRTSARDAG